MEVSNPVEAARSGNDEPLENQSERPREPTAEATQLDGGSFPDGVLSLTWDDGPDRHSLELAEYLREKHVSGTFFVVRDWSRALSSYPGYGASVENTGYDRIPILQALVRLGHRVANHTEHHVFLDRVGAADARRELLLEQQSLARFETDELSLFRVPGGVWSREIAEEENAAPELRQLVGPVRWDVDRKDWESSIQCDSAQPGIECEVGGAGRRLKPAVTAARYLESIAKAQRGIVLLHDRVADVGSRYALDVARALVPALIQRGYVFAAPVLTFSPLKDRLTPATRAALAAASMQRWMFYDENRDGRADLCVQGSDGWSCFPSAEVRQVTADRPPESMFEPAVSSQTRPAQVDARTHGCALPGATSARPADIDGDGREECCALTAEGVACAGPLGASIGAPAVWSSDPVFRSAFANGSNLLVGDLNGDGRADVCTFQAGAIACAFSTGSAFTRPTVWARLGILGQGDTLALADVNGDFRADLCVVNKGLVSCGLAP